MEILYVKIIISEIKILPNGLNSRLDIAKEEIKELEAQKVKRLKKWTDPRGMRDNIKWSSIGVTGVLEGKEIEFESQKLFEDTMTKFSPLFDESH